MVGKIKNVILQFGWNIGETKVELFPSGNLPPVFGIVANSSAQKRIHPETINLHALFMSVILTHKIKKQKKKIIL